MRQENGKIGKFPFDAATSLYCAMSNEHQGNLWIYPFVDDIYDIVKKTWTFFSTQRMPKNEKPTKKKHHRQKSGLDGVQRCLCRWFVPALL